MKTTFSRNFVTYAVILLVALLLVGVSFQFLAKDYLEDKAVQLLKNDSLVISQVATAYYTENSINSRDFLTNISIAARVSQADAVICDAQGTVVLCSDAPMGCAHQGMRITNRDYLNQMQTREYIVTQGVIAGMYTDNRYVVFTPIRESDSTQVIGFVMVSSPTADTLAMLRKFSTTYLFITVLVVLAAVVVMTFYTKKHASPLRDMAKTAIAFGHGNFSARAQVQEDAPEEIRDLALAFNNMAQSLEKGEYQRKDFVANVSHELKTPMTTIGGYVDGILDGTIPPEQQRKYLQIVSTETKRLSRLVRSMLDISRLQDQGGIPEEKKSRFDIGECAGQVLITFEKRILEKHLSVDVQMPEHPVYTFASEDSITQVVYNLIDNATLCD